MKKSNGSGSGYIFVSFKMLMIAGAAVFLLFAGCSRDSKTNKSSQKNSPFVQIERVALKTLTRSIELTGSVEPTRVARVASPAEGPVLHCTVREGDPVKKGEVILSLGRSQATEESVSAARQALAREEEDLRRIEQLVRSGAVPAEQKEEAQLRVARARAQLTKALENKDDYQIRAPWEGIVSKVFVTDGDFVSPRETLSEIFDPQSLVIRFAVPETESIHINIGMKITVLLDAHKNRSFHAKITRLYPELNRKTLTRSIEASLLDDLQMTPGMFARITVPIQVISDAIVIPEASLVMTPQGEPYVFIVRGGKALKQAVQTGMEHEQQVQITAGINAGDYVVVAGSRRLKNNMDVRVINDQKQESTIQ